jgi:hypothetical protein
MAALFLVFGVDLIAKGLPPLTRCGVDWG